MEYRRNASSFWQLWGTWHHSNQNFNVNNPCQQLLSRFPQPNAKTAPSIWSKQSLKWQNHNRKVPGYESVELMEPRLAFEVSWVSVEAVPWDRLRAELEAISSCCLVCLCINLTDVRTQKITDGKEDTDLAYSDIALSELSNSYWLNSWEVDIVGSGNSWV